MQALTSRSQYLNLVNEGLSLLKDEEQQEDFTGSIQALEALRKSISEGELLVLVVGGFSAGKSTLLNTLLGKTILPSDIKPETALAAELHYGANEYIEACKADGSSVRFDIDKMPEITLRAAEFSHLKLHINNELLRNLEPLVIVDMPGFYSPRDQHNEAIGRYIDKGCYYIALISSEEGTVSMQMLQQLELIDSYDHDVAVVLSKSDLRPQSVLDEIKAEIKNNLEQTFIGKTFTITQVNNKSAADVQTLLNNLNGDALFRSMFAKGTKQTLETLSADFALHAKALTRSKDLLAQDIENVDKSIAELRRKGESLKRDLNTRFNINNLSKEGVETIIAELDFKKENLADIALAGNVEVAEAMFNDVVHTALVNYLKSKFTDIDSQIIKECQSVLGQFDGSILSGEENLSFSEQVVNAFTSKTNLAQALRQVNKPDSSTLSTVMSAPVWGLLDKGFSSIPLPQIKILKEVVMGIKFLLKEFLPGILTDLLSKFKRGSIRSKMIENIATTVYPSLRANLSKALESLLQEQISKKVVNVFTAFENTVEDKRAVLEQSMSAQREELIQTSKRVEILEVKAQKAKSLAAEIK